MLAARTGSAVLFVALLPSLTFFGHWSLRVEIPGTGYYVGATPAADAHSSEGHDHSKHCHENMATCSDVPFAGGATVALLQDQVSVLHLLGMAYRAPVAEAAAIDAGARRPDLQPPRLLANDADYA